MKQILLLCLCFWAIAIKAQKKNDSETTTVIKYDLSSHSADKPIPFDAPFTLQLVKAPIKNITHVYAYQAEFKNGERTGVLGKYYDDNRQVISDKAVYDIDLGFMEESETIFIYFKPLKPGVLFDLIIETQLSEICTKELLKVNALLAQGIAQIDQAKNQFTVLRACTIDKTNMQTAFAMNWNDYQYFFAKELAKEYWLLNMPLEQAGKLSVLESDAICGLIKDYGDCKVLKEVAENENFEFICAGLINIESIITNEITTIYDKDQQISNLTANQFFFEDLLKKINAFQAQGKSEIKIEETILQTGKLGENVAKICEAINKNLKGLQEKAEDRRVTVLESSAVCRLIKDYSGCDLLYEAARTDSFKNICDGTANITTIFQDKKTAIYDADQRIINLTANQSFFEDLLKKINVAKALGNSKISIEGTTVNTERLRAIAAKIYESINKHIKWLQKRVEKRNSVIRKNAKIRQETTLAGSTVSSDLKSASGRVLFFDMGLSTIFARDLHKEIEKLPSLHLGFSIYFRSIDKNTRYSRFRGSMYPKKVKIHELDTITCVPGPDYEMMTRPTILQNLSLSVGLTLSPFPNTEFDNFYKNMSLTAGPAYRFWRGFKISSGPALLRRTASNPLISEKKVVMGAYVSVSVDIDFLGEIEKVTSIVFK